MARYRITFKPRFELVVDVDVEPPVGVDPEDFDAADAAQDVAGRQAQEYLDKLVGDHRGLRADADLDGIGAETVKEI